MSEYDLIVVDPPSFSSSKKMGRRFEVQRDHAWLIERCLEIAAHVKADRPLGRQAPTAGTLEGRHVAMLFEKASLRTRSTNSSHATPRARR